jgi:hypothetical protein
VLDGRVRLNTADKLKVALKAFSGW